LKKSRIVKIKSCARLTSVGIQSGKRRKINMSLKQYLGDLEKRILPGLVRGRERKQASERWEQWYFEQQRKLDSGAEVEPPWIAFPNSDALSGWNQGNTEA